ncbi:hypothetical protein [Pseudoponticoccus marisrubri]|nr:hypothetical protein [Pseudoponticoccus marisrubri]
MKTFRAVMLGAGLVVLPVAGLAQAPSAPSPGGLSLEMRAVTVQGQSQLRGRFGDAWSANEVRERAAQACVEGGMGLVYFQPRDTDRRGRTEFVAVCQ